MNWDVGKSTILLSLAALLFAVPLPAQKLIAKVPTGSRPTALAVNPVTNRIYVTNGDSNVVTVIDGATNTVITNVLVETDPEAVAVNTTTNKIYVANAGDGLVTVIDGATNKIVTFVPTGISPAVLAVNESTNKIYVLNRGGDFITEIDGATNTATSVHVGSNLLALAVNPKTNKIYVARGGTTVMVMDGATHDITSVDVGAGAGLRAVAVNQKTNEIWVTNNGDESVTKIDGDTNLTVTVPGSSYPTSLAVNQLTDTIYVGNSLSFGIFPSRDVTVIDGASLSHKSLFTGFASVSVAVDEAINKTYLANTVDTMTVIDGATNAVAILFLGGRPIAVAANSKTNRAYVANSSDNNVAVIGWPFDIGHSEVSPAVSLAPGEIAKLCATNLQRSPVSAFMILRQADNFDPLASKHVTLEPGAGECLNFTQQFQPNGNPPLNVNVLGFVVPEGRLNGQGEVVQDRPGGGGCITASLEIQLPGQNNAPPQTFLYVPLEEHHDAHRRRDRD